MVNSTHDFSAIYIKKRNVAHFVRTDGKQKVTRPDELMMDLPGDFYTVMSLGEEKITAFNKFTRPGTAHAMY